MSSYNVLCIHYRDIYGVLLWKSPMLFKCLHALGEDIAHKSRWFTVKRVAVVDHIQHVNLEISNSPESVDSGSGSASRIDSSGVE